MDGCAQLIVVDLEATCWRLRTFPKKQEIIEIAAARIDKMGEIRDEFDAFVRPVKHPELSPFCTELTTIRQQDVDQAETFPKVWERFCAWVGKPVETCLMSWGGYDDRQMRQDCALHSLEYPFDNHRNLKLEFSAQYGTKPRGMAEALRRLNLPLEGQHHRGRDDVRNIVRIYRTMIEQKGPQRATNT